MNYVMQLSYRLSIQITSYLTQKFYIKHMPTFFNNFLQKLIEAKVFEDYGTKIQVMERL